MEEASQDAYAEEHVARALSLAATILEASPRGLTKTEIWERIEFYPARVSTPEEREAREKVFDRDKKYLSQNGIRLIQGEGSSEYEYRYAIDPEDYGLPQLELTAAELMLLRQLQRLWRGRRGRATMLQAIGALTGYQQDLRHAGDPVPPLSAPPLELGDDRDFEHLETLAGLGERPAISFDYVARGRFEAESRRVVMLGVGVRGHWYLTGHDLDRSAVRTFRLDRIHGGIRALRRSELHSAQEAETVRAISASERLTDFDLSAALDDAAAASGDQQHRLRAALQAHRSPPEHPGRLRPMREGRSPDPAPQKVERLLSMTAHLHSTGGVRVSELLVSYGVGPAQLQRDLLSLQQTGSYDADRFGSLAEVRPEIPLTFADFEKQFVEEDPLVSLELPDGALRGTLTRPIRLSVPMGLSLLIGVHSLEASPVVDGLRHKLQEVLPEQMRHVADQVSLSGVELPGAEHAQVLAGAAEQGRAVELDYEDAQGRTSRRTVEPTAVFRSGPHSYLRAWSRRDEQPRTFRISRIRSVEVLQEKIGAQARRLAELPIEAPRVPDDQRPVRAVLHFAAPAAAEADDYEPELHRWHEGGGRTVQARFRSEESLIRLCAEAGGDTILMEPEALRTQVIDRIESQLSPSRPQAE